MKDNKITVFRVTQRLITPYERGVFKYLHMLRNTGKINVYEAEPFLVERFTISQEEANDFLNMWLENFREDGNYKIIDVPKDEK